MCAGSANGIVSPSVKYERYTMDILFDNGRKFLANISEASKKEETITDSSLAVIEAMDLSSLSRSAH